MELNNNTTKWPLYAKLSNIIVGLVALFYVLYIGQDIIVPIVFSIIIAILLNPVVNFLCKKKFNRTIAIALSVITAILLLVTLAYFILSQAAMFGDSLPLFKQKFLAMFDDGIHWLSEKFNVSEPKIESWIKDTKADSLKKSTNVLGPALASIGGVIVLVLLIPVYIFMLLYYKQLLVSFILQIFKRGNKHLVKEVLAETKTLIQSYLVGLLIEAGIVASINSVGLLLLGIQYAVLIAIIGALLNLIPYIGGIIAISIPLLIAIATKAPIYSLWVFILFISVQIIDNNYIVPKIVASKVKVNALISIIVVLIGGALWGVAGMFLAIPLTAIVKVIFDRVPSLKPFGFVIGDELPVDAKSIIRDKNSA